MIMLNENIETKKTLEVLSLYIEDLELLRTPVTMENYLNPFRLIKSFIKRRQKSFIVKNHPKIYSKTIKEMEPYKKDREFDPSDPKAIMLSLFFLLVFLVGVPVTLKQIFSLNFLYEILILIIMAIPTLYLYFAWFVTRRKRFLGRKYTSNIKIAVQRLINYGAELVREKNLNPKEFPIKLRHNDYQGLIYEKKGNNNYIGWFKK